MISIDEAIYQLEKFSDYAGINQILKLLIEIKSEYKENLVLLLIWLIKEILSDNNSDAIIIDKLILSHVCCNILLMFGDKVFFNPILSEDFIIGLRQIKVGIDLNQALVNQQISTQILQAMHNNYVKVLFNHEMLLIQQLRIWGHENTIYVAQLRFHPLIKPFFKNGNINLEKLYQLMPIINDPYVKLLFKNNLLSIEQINNWPANKVIELARNVEDSTIKMFVYDKLISVNQLYTWGLQQTLEVTSMLQNTNVVLLLAKKIISLDQMFQWPALEVIDAANIMLSKSVLTLLFRNIFDFNLILLWGAKKIVEIAETIHNKFVNPLFDSQAITLEQIREWGKAKTIQVAELAQREPIKSLFDAKLMTAEQIFRCGSVAYVLKIARFATHPEVNFLLKRGDISMATIMSTSIQSPREFIRSCIKVDTTNRLSPKFFVSYETSQSTMISHHP